MAEEVKQFTNGVLTASGLSSDGSTLSIFTNNSSTTRVVRSIQVQDADIESSTAKFEVGGTVVGDTFEDSTGTVVVPPSASLDIKLTTPIVAATKNSLTLRHQRFVSSSQLDFTPITGYQIEGTSDSRFAYDFSGQSFSTTTTTGTTQDFIPPFDSNIGSATNRVNFIQIPAEKTYYYFRVDQNSTSVFGKYVYSNNGAAGDSASHTVLTNNGYSGPAIDWQGSRMFIKEGSNIKEFDLTKAGGITSSTTPITHSGFYSTQSTYGNGAYCNGHYFYSYQGVIYVRNLAVSSGYGSVSAQTNGSYTKMTVLFNKSENRFYIIKGSHQRDGAEILYFDAALTTATTSNFSIAKTSISTNFQNYMNSITGGSNYNGYTWNIEAVDTNLVSIPYDENSTRLYKAVNGNLVYTGTAITVSSGNTAFPTNSDYKSVTPIGTINETGTNLPYSNYTFLTRVRTEGVEIT